jgi:D-glycero-D-manno-heptose 1,7-bisphosphate phosphatase
MSATKRHDRVVFLDRDGVINLSPPPPGFVLRWEDFEFAPGALEALRSLNTHGFTVAVVTNQSCVGRGMTTLDTVRSIHARMAEAVAAAGGRLHGVYVCPHVKEDQCACRKPKPGLIDQATLELFVDPARAFLVGDSERDLRAGQARGCTTILVAESQEPLPKDLPCDHVASDLSEAVALILRLVERGA